MELEEQPKCLNILPKPGTSQRTSLTQRSAPYSSTTDGAQNHSLSATEATPIPSIPCSQEIENHVKSHKRNARLIARSTSALDARQIDTDPATQRRNLA